jgi:hypothetical protein
MVAPTDHRRALIRTAVVLWALGVSSCDRRDERVPPHVNDLRELAYVEEIRIGSADDPDSGFSRIRTVRVSDKGDVYVLDATSREVRVFSAKGERLRVMGGPGDGPGEFSLPGDMGLIGDTLWVEDGGRRRLTWFGPNGDVLSTMSTQGVPFESGVRGVSIRLTPSRPRPDGLIESDRSLVVSPDREIRPYRYPVVLFDRQGAVVDTLRWETADENAVTFRAAGRQGYAPVLGPVSPVVAELVDGWVVVDWTVPAGTTNGLMNIRRVRHERDTVYRQALRYRAVPVPDSILDSLIAPRLSIAAMLGLTEGQMQSALREAIDLPESRPPIRIVYAGGDGTVWVQLNTPPADVAEWVLIGADGSPQGRLKLPARMRIYHSELPTIWAVDLDDVDVPWLVRLRVE